MMIPDVSVIKERTEQAAQKREAYIAAAAERLAEEKMEEVLKAADKALYRITWQLDLNEENAYIINHRCLKIFENKGYKTGCKKITDNTISTINYCCDSYHSATYESSISWED